MERSSSKNFRIVYLGCRTNQYEAQAFQDQLFSMGFFLAEENETADLCIMNTCTITSNADKDTSQAIHNLARQNLASRIAVTGFGVESQREAIAGMPEVSAIIPNAKKEELVQLLLTDEQAPEFFIKNFDAHTRAFVKVQDGCNSYYTYCVIPYVRGRLRSRCLDEILAEVQNLVSNAFKEIVITGINVGDFDGNADVRLAELVRAVDCVPGLERSRISFIDSDEVDAKLIDAVILGQHTCPSIPSMHIVLQSGSNVILKCMNCKYTRQIFLQTVERLRAACPNFTFTTDANFGSTGKTEADFQDTLVNTVEFAKVHMFSYSPRLRTRAALLPNQAPFELMRERKKRLMRGAEQAAFKPRAAYVGHTMSVLTESKYSEHTENFLSVYLADQGLQANQLVNVELVENTSQGLLERVLHYAD